MSKNTPNFKFNKGKLASDDAPEPEDDSVEENEEEEDNEEEDGAMEMKLPKSVMRRVLALRKQHTQFEEIDDEYKKERIALEIKFQAQRKTLYEERKKIVTGEVEPPEDADLEKDESEDLEEGADIKNIPQFWFRCLGNCETISDYFSPEDVEALEHLTDLTCEYSEDYTSYTLSFHFSENPFFSDSVLTKAYTVSPDLLDENPSLEDATGCEIHWKAGHNLTVTETKKKQKAKSGKNKGQVRTITVTKPKASFFHYFSEPKEQEEEEEEEEDDEEGGKGKEDDCRLQVDEDYDIGHTIRTAIIPQAILWFTGEAVPENPFDEEIDDDEVDGVEGDEDEEDDDEEEEDVKPKGKGKGNKGKGGAPAGGEQPECKQN